MKRVATRATLLGRTTAIFLAVMLIAPSSALAAIGVRIDQAQARIGQSLHVTAWGPAGTAGLPVYLAPASIDFSAQPCGQNTKCFPLTNGPPGGPYVRLGRLPKTLDVFHRRRLTFRVPNIRTGRYRVVVYCDVCVPGPEGSLLASLQSVQVTAGHM